MNCNNVKWTTFYMEESLSLCLISLSLNPHQTLQIIILRWSLANDADKFPQVLISNLIKSTGTRELVVVVVVVGTHRRWRHQTKFIVPHTSDSSQQGQVYSAPQQTFLILILNNFVICLTVTASGRMCSSLGTQPLLRRPMWHNEDNNMEQLRVHQLSNSANTERRRGDRCLCIEAAGSVNISIVTGTIIWLLRYSRSCSLAGLLAAWPASLSRSCSCTGDTFTAVAGDMVIIWSPSVQTPSNCPVKDNG